MASKEKSLEFLHAQELHFDTSEDFSKQIAADLERRFGSSTDAKEIMQNTLSDPLLLTKIAGLIRVPGLVEMFVRLAQTHENRSKEAIENDNEEELFHSIIAAFGHAFLLGYFAGQGPQTAAGVSIPGSQPEQARAAS